MYAHIIGLGMSLASMLWIPGYAIYYIVTQRGSLRDVSYLLNVIKMRDTFQSYEFQSPFA